MSLYLLLQSLLVQTKQNKFKNCYKEPLGTRAILDSDCMDIVVYFILSEHTPELKERENWLQMQDQNYKYKLVLGKYDDVSFIA